MLRLVTASAISAILLSACQPAETDSTPVLSYTDAFIMQPVAGRDMTVGGINITSEGGDVRLTGVTSDVAGTVETHTMSMEGGSMKMRPVEGFDIADGETLELKRGGNHLMLFDVSPDITPGDTANLTLNFETSDGETLTLEAEADIRALGE